ncbi:MAG: sensor histidine kinase [Alkalispirochaeta sp.]
MLVIDLIENVALLLALTVVYDLVSTRGPIGTRSTAVLHGLLFGVIAVIGMMIPMNFVPGVVYDGRSIVLAAAGYVGGPITAGIAATIAVAYRIFLGGVGAFPGALVIVEAAALGTVVYYLRQRDARWERTPWILGLGIAVHGLMLAVQLLLPRDLGLIVVRRFGVVILLLYPVALLVVLRIFVSHQRQRDMLRELYLATYSMEHSAVAIYRADEPDGRIRYANEQACRSMGYTKDELLTMTVYDIDPTFSAPYWQEHRQQVWETGPRTIETVHRRKDGSQFPVEITVSPISYQGESFTLTFSHDISERKRAKAEIEASLEEKQVLLQEIHHRVRNNLAVLSGLVNLQITHVSSTDASVPAIEKTRDRIMVMAMIHDMMYQAQDFSRVDFSAFVRSITARLQQAYYRPNTTLAVVTDAVSVDVTYAVPLGLLLNEAVTNALKHAHPLEEPGKITVRVWSERAGVGLTVTDDGVGMIGDPDASGSLGFELMSSLARQVGSRLLIDSREGGGCAITVTTEA